MNCSICGAALYAGAICPRCSLGPAQVTGPDPTEPPGPQPHKADMSSDACPDCGMPTTITDGDRTWRFTGHTPEVCQAEARHRMRILTKSLRSEAVERRRAELARRAAEAREQAWREAAEAMAAHVQRMESRHHPLCALVGGYALPCDCGLDDARALYVKARALGGQP